MYRIGLGYDIHKLTQGRDLIIGGVKITHEKGLLGHSDADVLVHAIIDGMLGALALADIGTLFPDTDPFYKDADSTVLLKKVYELIKEKNYEIQNIDSNIIAQRPKMMPYIPKMRDALAKILEINFHKSKNQRKNGCCGAGTCNRSARSCAFEKGVMQLLIN